MSWLGLDIGGANLKAADGRGWGRSVPYALWRQPEGLSAALAALVDSAPAADRIAVTMTGELCDCFQSKADGVRHILSEVEQVAGLRDARIYLLDGQFATINEAQEKPHLAAASNWHALAAFACRFVSGRAGLLIDIGSTTTDVIPLVDGQVAARGRTDTERLQAGELLYRGVGRTPICAVTKALPWRGKPCPIAAEFFATTADAYVVLGDLTEDPHAEWTADGRPLTLVHACQRLARQLCADATEFALEEIQLIAQAAADIQLRELRECVEAVIRQMAEWPSTIVLSGSGEFLGRRVVEQSMGEIRVRSLAEKVGVEAAKSAPAHAIAVLAAQFFGTR